MPALSADQANSAVIAHFTQPLDSSFGILANEDGLILQSVAPKTTRQADKYYGISNELVGIIYTRPEVIIDIEGDTTLKDALIPGAHPGTALTLAEFASLNPDMALGVPTDEGFLSVLSNTRGVSPGKLFKCSVSAQLMRLPSTDIQVFLAA